MCLSGISTMHNEAKSENAGVRDGTLLAKKSLGQYDVNIWRKKCVSEFKANCGLTT